MVRSYLAEKTAECLEFCHNGKGFNGEFSADRSTRGVALPIEFYEQMCQEAESNYLG